MSESRLIDITGQRFGRWTVVKHIYGTKPSKWLCRCDCGNVKEIRGADLKAGRTKSCGCYMREQVRKPKKHGMSKTKIYIKYQAMISRCKYPSNINYKAYGGRGIRVCDEWLKDFKVFYKWAMENGYKDGLTIDRINVDGNYEPSNCRFVPMSEQYNNRTDNHYLTYNGETHSISEWSRITGINAGTIKSRINTLHWSDEEAITKPAKKLTKKGV